MPQDSAILPNGSYVLAMSCCASSIRLRIRYRCTGKPKDRLKARAKWQGESLVTEATSVTFIGSARFFLM